MRYQAMDKVCSQMPSQVYSKRLECRRDKAGSGVKDQKPRDPGRKQGKAMLTGLEHLQTEISVWCVLKGRC